MGLKKKKNFIPRHRLFILIATAGFALAGDVLAFDCMINGETTETKNKADCEALQAKGSSDEAKPATVIGENPPQPPEKKAETPPSEEEVYVISPAEQAQREEQAKAEEQSRVEMSARGHQQNINSYSYPTNLSGAGNLAPTASSPQMVKAEALPNGQVKETWRGTYEQLSEMGIIAGNETPSRNDAPPPIGHVA